MTKLSGLLFFGMMQTAAYAAGAPGYCQSTWTRELMTRLQVQQPFERSQQSVRACWPRLRWEVSFFGQPFD